MNRKTLERLAGHYPKGFKGHQIDMGKWHIPEAASINNNNNNNNHLMAVCPGQPR